MPRLVGKHVFESCGTFLGLRFKHGAVTFGVGWRGETCQRLEIGDGGLAEPYGSLPCRHLGNRLRQMNNTVGLQGDRAVSGNAPADQLDRARKLFSGLDGGVTDLAVAAGNIAALGNTVFSLDVLERKSEKCAAGSVVTVTVAIQTPS